MDSSDPLTHASASKPSANPPRVLVVEDEPLIREYVSDVLGQSGFDVLQADTAADALAQIGTDEDFCAVVSDVAMPGPFDGFELARRVREGFPRMGIILVSGVSEPKDMYIPLGVRFLAKPVRAVTLLRLVREVADPRVELPAYPACPASEAPP
jgi:CheY-like chemotaxis protein